MLGICMHHGSAMQLHAASRCAVDNQLCVINGSLKSLQS